MTQVMMPMWISVDGSEPMKTKDAAKRVGIEEHRLKLAIWYGQDVIKGHRVVFVNEHEYYAKYEPPLVEREVDLRFERARRVADAYTRKGGGLLAQVQVAR